MVKKSRGHFPDIEPACFDRKMAVQSWNGSLWVALQMDQSRHYTAAGEFVVFPGYEFTYHRHDLQPSHNHRIVVYPEAGGHMFRRLDREACSDRKLMRRLRHMPAMAYPHHGTYRIMNPELEWNVEVCSSWRVYIEELDFTLNQLRQGHRFGFIGSSDTHRSVPGLGGGADGRVCRRANAAEPFRSL